MRSASDWIRRLPQTRDGRSQLVFFLLIAVSLWAFVGISGEVMEGDTQALDRRVLEAFRTPGDLSDPLGPVWFEQSVRDITALGGSTILTLISVAVLGFLLIEGKLHTAGFLLLAVLGGLLISLALKYGFDRPRPDFLTHGQKVYTASFPSGHSMNAAIVYLTLGAILAKAHKSWAIRIYVLSVVIVITVMVGLSRVYLGVHWPTDVLAGWVAGAAWSLVCWTIFHALQAHRVVEQESEVGTPGSPPAARDAKYR